MPTPAKGPRLGGSPAHERLILANLATSLFEHGRITTTETKAKRLRPLAERLITFAKRGDLASRRRVLRVVKNKGVVHALFTEIGPQMAERAGGYTRVTKVGPRKGDNAPMAVIELVTEPVSPKQAVVREAERAKAQAPRGGVSGGARPRAEEATPVTTASAEAAPTTGESGPVQAPTTGPAEAGPAETAAGAGPAPETGAEPAADAATEAPVEQEPSEEEAAPPAPRTTRRQA